MEELKGRFRELFGDPDTTMPGAAKLKRFNEQTNVGPIPEVADPQRRLDCEFDFRKFCQTYLAGRFYHNWAKFHLDMFDIITTSLDMGGQYAYAMPRGSGKTTIAEACLMWCLLYGKRKYAIVIGATSKSAASILLGIRSEIETNNLFMEDFPEVGYVVQTMKVSQGANAKYFHLDGEPIRYSSTEKRIILPTVPGAMSSGGMVEAFSIHSTDLRGRRYIMADGTAIRPDFVMIDDPQSDASARSAALTRKIEEAIEKTIKGLSGPGKKLTIIMPCTVIKRNDLADRYLNRDIQPEWNGTRTKMLDRMPDNMDLWKTYHDVRMQSFKDGTYGVNGLDFYLANRDAMDKGGIATWDERYIPPLEVSALQHAMNKFLTNPNSFASEYQNEPQDDDILDEGNLLIRAGDLAERLIVSNDFVVPMQTEMITAGIDIQGKILYYLVVAWTEDFGGVITDWGSIPDQKCDFWNTQNPPIPLQTIANNLAPNPLVYEGLTRLMNGPLKRQYKTFEGLERGDLHVEKVLVDANYSVTNDAVHSFCNAYSSMFHATHGRGIPATGLPMTEWAKRHGERKGTGWIIRPNTGMSNKGRHILIDSYYWKDRMAERLTCPLGTKNALLFRNAGYDQSAFLYDQLASEKPIPTFGRGRWVNQWMSQINKTENHWWDCLINAAVAASISGMQLHTISVDGNAIAAPKNERRIVDTSKFSKAGR